MKSVVRPETPSIDPNSASKTHTEHIQKPSKEKSRDASKVDPGVDRPGFDLGGASGETTAGAGLGLGNNAGESRAERSLPGRRPRVSLHIPRWKS